MIRGLLLLSALLSLSGCTAEEAVTVTGTEETAAAAPAPPAAPAATALTLQSPAFAAGGSIPAEYTCQGTDAVPPLRVGGVPPEAKGLALIVEDPDVPREIRPDGMWDHWVVWNIPPGTTSLDELPPGAVEGRNSWERNEWGGPCPPSGEHRYYFRLYALDAPLELDPKAGKNELRHAMEGHVLATAELMGRFAAAQ